MMTTRQKKIFIKKLESKNSTELADAWKNNKDKKLSPEEMEQFELIRKHYKTTTGKTLPSHSTKQN